MLLINKTQKTLFKSFYNNNNKKNFLTLILNKQKKNESSYSASTLIQKQALKPFSQKQTRTEKLAQSPEQLYTTPIYDKENPEFSETYLNFLFNLNAEELNQTKTDFPKLTENIITLLKLFPTLSNQAAYSPKLEFLLDFIYQNAEKFSCFALIKIFQTLIETKIGGCNLPIKLNFYIAAKLQQVKAQALKQKNSLEEFIHAFFNHFHFCAESGYSSRHILNSFLNILGSENLLNNNSTKTKLFANESNVNNVIYLIALSVANVNEADKNELTEKAFLDPQKDVISVSNMTVLLQLLRKAAENFEILSENESEKSNSRNRLFKALKFLSAEGVALPSALERFLTVYDSAQIEKFEAHEFFDTERPAKLAGILEKIGLRNFEKDKKFEFCAVDFFVEPSVCVRINREEDFSNELLKGKVNLVNRYLYLKNYDVVNLPFFVFKDEAKLEELFKKRFYHVVNEGFDRLNADKSVDMDSEKI